MWWVLCFKMMNINCQLSERGNCLHVRMSFSVSSDRGAEFPADRDGSFLNGFRSDQQDS